MDIRAHDIKDITITPEILKLIAEIDEFKGRWKVMETLAPEKLTSLKRIATIESVGSSTRIEGAKLSDREVEKLLSGVKAKSFASRDEQEVAGYADAMDMIFESFESITLTENHIKQLHGVLFKYSSKDQDHRGEYKKVTNHVEAFGPALFASPRFQRALWSPSGSFAVESHSESDCRDEAPAPSCAWTDFGEGQGLDCAVRRDEATLHSPNKSVSQACAGSNLPPKSSAGRMRL